MSSRSMRVVMLTSTFLRHQYAVNTVASQLEVAGVWQEQKSFKPESYGETADDRAVIAQHFAARDASEQLFFGEHRLLRLRQTARCYVGGPGFINDPDEVAVMNALQPDLVLVFGTGLLRGGIIERFAGRILNLHLGLSPFYRGAGTNFWPLVNDQPEYVGATIHYLDAGIDTGPILSHARPAISAADGPHEIGNKAIISAVDTFIAAAQACMTHTVRGVPQTGGGRLYQRKDFSASAVRTLWRNFETGMIRRYLDAKASRDAQLQLVALPQAS